MSSIPPISAPMSMATPTATSQAKEVAQQLEAAFLAQMLTLAGVGKTPDGFGGGTGESQFSSFLVQEYAQAMAQKGGIGLAQHIFNAMVDQKGDL